MVFSFAGDLSLASTAEGLATRLTAHHGLELFPRFGTNGADGSWVVENVGVEPDIEVENDPRSVIAGRDPQLERAVEEVLRLMRENPKSLPERPAPPVKTPRR